MTRERIGIGKKIGFNMKIEKDMKKRQKHTTKIIKDIDRSQKIIGIETTTIKKEETMNTQIENMIDKEMTRNIEDKIIVLATTNILLKINMKTITNIGVT